MDNHLHPWKAIVPIVRFTHEQAATQILGTGFFVGSDATLHVVTAKHVIENNPLQSDEKYAIAFRKSKSPFTFFHMREIIPCNDYDIAVCEFPKADFDGDVVALPIDSSQPPLNHDVLSYEYSASRIERTAGHTLIAFNPYSHKGHIVFAYDSEYPEKKKTKSFLVSFPALQGASGAPLLVDRKQISSIGMLVANVEQHLLPAQTVQIEDETGYREKTSYFLPYGKALAGSVIVECLTEMRVPFTLAPKS